MPYVNAYLGDKLYEKVKELAERPEYKSDKTGQSSVSKVVQVALNALIQKMGENDETGGDM